MPSAAQRVIGTAELVETIVLQLPTKDTLLGQRISRSIKEIMNGSVAIQKTMFLYPGEASSASIDAPIVHLGPHVEHLAFLNQIPIPAQEIASFNPLLTRTLNPSQLLRPKPQKHTASELYIDLLDTPSHWSCNKMYISQPPIRFQTMKFEYATETRMYRQIRYGFSTGLLGLTLDMVAQGTRGKGVPVGKWEVARSFEKWFFCLQGAVPEQ
ncbi:hypothetical protein Slin14017_G091640 [Septoria linicola]|nr:hypothetical protein Slin14017_G091640 [Septoria linicola]